MLRDCCTVKGAVFNVDRGLVDDDNDDDDAIIALVERESMMTSRKEYDATCDQPKEERSQ
jgi:hypothetical protein